MLLMLLIVVPMASKRLKMPSVLHFETRLNMHWLFLPMLVILMWHAQRTAYVVIGVGGVWLLDYAYMYLTRTVRTLAPRAPNALRFCRAFV